MTEKKEKAAKAPYVFYGIIIKETEKAYGIYAVSVDHLEKYITHKGGSVEWIAKSITTIKEELEYSDTDLEYDAENYKHKTSKILMFEQPAWASPQATWARAQYKYKKSIRK